MTKRSVSITGASGFVGWHTAETFRAQGWQVRAIVRPGSRKPLPEGVETARSTLALDPLADAMRGTDLVVQCADAQDVLGFTAQEDFADSIARTATWYRDAGWL